VVPGIYISVPFCRSKCSYCNFASGVFGQALYGKYVERLLEDIRQAEATAAEMGGQFDRTADTVYLGGGSPTLLEPDQVKAIFTALRETFTFAPEPEITVECAPGTLAPAMLEALLQCGVNRASLGVQSFVDEETRAVGRLHTRAAARDDIRRLRAAGVCNLNVDLIAGLPHQTAQSWAFSLDEVIAAEAPHVSVYMLEVDQDSRLGKEVMAGGRRYHAHFVPDDGLTADLYLQACERLEAAGICQYEISNFARPARESRHNLKYWTRQPYLGFGLDAHSFLPVRKRASGTSRESAPEASKFQICDLPSGPDCGLPSHSHRAASPCPDAAEAVRFATADSLEDYLAAVPRLLTQVSPGAAREECFFLGLRLNRGVELHELARECGLPVQLGAILAELQRDGLIEYDREREVVRLSQRGRLLSNEVFARFLA
jgi:oxygen-independent coproporphyrinogen-3 oxidase